MQQLLRTLLLGADRSGGAVLQALVGLAIVFAVTFLAYALGVFAVGGGVVFLPGDAAVVGVVGAAVLAFQHRGLVLAWLVVYVAMLAYSADHYLLGLSHRSFAYGVGAIFQPDGLLYFAVVALVLGTMGWLVGTGARLTYETLDADAASDGS